MPYYRVLIEGKDLRMPEENGSPGIAGFFTTRVVCAGTQSQAEAKALDAVRATWRQPPYVNQPGVERLTISVSEVSRSGFLQWLRAPRRGHTFYSEESPSEA